MQVVDVPGIHAITIAVRAMQSCCVVVAWSRAFPGVDWSAVFALDEHWADAALADNAPIGTDRMHRPMIALREPLLIAILHLRNPGLSGWGRPYCILCAVLADATSDCRFGVRA
jgi:hypothetical protein